MKDKFMRLVSAIPVMVVLAGCVTAPQFLETHPPPTQAPVDTRPAPTKTPVGSPVSPSTTGEEDSVPDRPMPFIKAALAELSDRLGVDPDRIDVAGVEAVIWPDASLGCPEPGMAYIQVLSPGYRVLLVFDGAEYVYHTDQGKSAVTCEEADVTGTPGSFPEIEAGLESLIEQAKAMLAEQLSIETSQITVIEARSVVWGDTSMGCPQPGMLYLQVPQDGALIRLAALGLEYDYHSGGTRGLFLCTSSGENKKSAPPNLDPIIPPPTQ